MSAAPPDYEGLLREAISRARETAPSAVDDLFRITSGATQAVTEVTGGAAVLELVPVQQSGDVTPVYQLQLRKVGSEAPPSDLGIFRLSDTGYPVQRWYSRGAWESRPEDPDEVHQDATALEGSFRWMVSNPKSRLVVLVAFFQQLSGSKGSAARPA